MSTFGRRPRPEPVFVNVYDLQRTEVNDMLMTVGLGVFHSGIEVHGAEWTFGSGGGVFSHAPKAVPGGARLRCSVLVGEVEATSREVERIVDSMRAEWPGSRYNVVHCNCNAFSLELGKRLTGRAIPGWINRLSSLGALCSCLMPQEAAAESPVGGGGGGGGSGGSGSGAGASTGGGRPKPPAFSGTGRAIGTIGGLGGSGGGSGGGVSLSNGNGTAFEARGPGASGSASASASASASRSAAGGGVASFFTSAFTSAPAAAAAAPAPARTDAAAARELMLQAALRRTAQAQPQRDAEGDESERAQFISK